MTFGAPQFLLLLFLLPAAVLFLLWARRRRRAALARLGDPALLRRLSETVNWRGRFRRSLLWFLAVAALILALARPQWGSEVQVVEQEGVQIMVALDISDSMLAQDLRPERLARARQTIAELMAQLEGDEVGLVLFSGASFIQFPLTSDYGTARAFLDAARPGMISRRGTALGDAIETAVSGFDPQRASQKVVLILTDGESHADDPVAAAETAAAEGVVIYAIGFGTGDGEPIPEYDDDGQFAGYKEDRDGQAVLSRLDEVTLQQVAAAGNGRYYRATAAGTEVDLLVDELNALETAALDSRLQTRRVERFQIFLALALLCLLLAELIPDRVQIPAPNPRHLLPMLLLTFLSACASGEAELIRRGNDAYAVQQYPEALTAYGEAQQVAPDRAEPIYNAANTRYRQENLAAAQQLMQQALPLAEAELAQFSHYNLGNFYFDQGDYAAAVEAYKEALRLSPADVDAKHNLELALQQLRAEQEGQEQEQAEDGPEQEQEQRGEGQEQEESGQEQEQAEDGGQQQEQQQEEAGSGAPPAEDAADAAAQPDEVPAQGLTPEQARQLLQAIGQNTETLQERLQRVYVAPGGIVDKDW